MEVFTEVFKVLIFMDPWVENIGTKLCSFLYRLFF